MTNDTDKDKKGSTGAPIAGPDPNEGPGKGKAFFDRAKTVAATGNFDYAIDMYIEGLNREPFNVTEHEALWQVGFNRKLKGGKPAGGLLGPKLPFKGKTPKEALLNHEFLLAKDVSNISAMLAIIRNAVILELKDVVMWVGPKLLKANESSKSPKKDLYNELADIYEKMEEFEQASGAIRAAIKLDPQNMELIARAKDLSAKETLQKGKYDKGASFQDSIRDKEQTKKLLQEDNLNRSEEYRLQAVATAKADYEKNPMELQVISKYVKALADMDDEQYENTAMDVLRKGFEETKIYRLKATIGDLRMKQFSRRLRTLADAVKANPADTDAVHKYEQLRKERLTFELGEFTERAENLPTDMAVKYELGRRLWEAKRYDDAIVALQEAQQNPRHRVDALHLLGRSFLQQGMKPEAVETLKKSIEEYDLAPTGDKTSKALHYWFARALEANNNLAEAIQNYSKIIRWDIGYLDARKRLNDLREQTGDAGASPAA
jgi:tetratricopeptide (TPR) repeat protein